MRLARLRCWRPGCSEKHGQHEAGCGVQDAVRARRRPRSSTCSWPSSSQDADARRDAVTRISQSKLYGQGVGDQGLRRDRTAGKAKRRRGASPCEHWRGREIRGPRRRRLKNHQLPRVPGPGTYGHRWPLCAGMRPRPLADLSASGQIPEEVSIASAQDVAGTTAARYRPARPDRRRPAGWRFYAEDDTVKTFDRRAEG